MTLGAQPHPPYVRPLAVQPARHLEYVGDSLSPRLQAATRTLRQPAQCHSVKPDLVSCSRSGSSHTGCFFASA